jgi:hypothetical protein
MALPLLKHPATLHNDCCPQMMSETSLYSFLDRRQARQASVADAGIPTAAPGAALHARPCSRSLLVGHGTWKRKLDASHVF